MQKWQNIPSTFIYHTFWQILDSGTSVSAQKGLILAFETKIKEETRMPENNTHN